MSPSLPATKYAPTSRTGRNQAMARRVAKGTTLQCTVSANPGRLQLLPSFQELALAAGQPSVCAGPQKRHLPTTPCCSPWLPGEGPRRRGHAAPLAYQTPGPSLRTHPLGKTAPTPTHVNQSGPIEVAIDERMACSGNDGRDGRLSDGAGRLGPQRARSWGPGAIPNPEVGTDSPRWTRPASFVLQGLSVGRTMRCHGPSADESTPHPIQAL